MRTISQFILLLALMFISNRRMRNREWGILILNTPMVRICHKHLLLKLCFVVRALKMYQIWIWVEF